MSIIWFQAILACTNGASDPIRIGTLADSLSAEPSSSRTIMFIAGGCSHGRGEHEHIAGSQLLANILNKNGPDVKATVYRQWPKIAQAFDGVDAIVIFADGGENHPINAHLDQVDKLMKRGVGLACLHYAVEVPKGKPGNYFLDWIGGYFETHWSVNPVWKANFTSIPDHPVTRGVKPFRISDEWYYHMRFRENEQDITPILTAIPPASTLKREDGAHSNNPYVRAKKGQPQHVAWVYERPDGGRGFGFTGAHVHSNWQDDNFRKLVLNAITWIAKAEVPAGGIQSATPSRQEIKANVCE